MDVSQYWLPKNIFPQIHHFSKDINATLLFKTPEMVHCSVSPSSTPHQGGALGPDSKRQRVTADAETARKELLGKFEPTDTFEAIPGGD